MDHQVDPKKIEHTDEVVAVSEEGGVYVSSKIWLMRHGKLALGRVRYISPSA